MAILRRNFHIWNFLFGGPIAFLSSQTCTPAHLCCHIGGLHPGTRDRRNYAGFLGVPWVKPKDLFQCFNESRTNIILKDRLKKRQNNISQKKKTQNTFTPAPKSRKISWWNARINRDSLLFLMHSCFGCLIATLTDYFDDISQKTWGSSKAIHSVFYFFKFSVAFICHTRVASLYRGRASPLRKPSKELRKQ